MNKRKRDVEKDYPLDQFVEKLRRLADAIEKGERFEIQIAGERVYVPVRATFTSSTSAAMARKKSSSRSSGKRNNGFAFQARLPVGVAVGAAPGAFLGGRVTGPACQYDDHRRTFCR
jgi:hypothetical protein